MILDLILPTKLGGLEVCRRIRSERRVPLIMLTAKGEEEDRALGLSAGADDYVSSPSGRASWQRGSARCSGKAKLERAGQKMECSRSTSCGSTPVRAR